MLYMPFSSGVVASPSSDNSPTTLPLRSNALLDCLNFFFDLVPFLLGAVMLGTDIPAVTGTMPDNGTMLTAVPPAVKHAAYALQNSALDIVPAGLLFPTLALIQMSLSASFERPVCFNSLLAVCEGIVPFVGCADSQTASADAGASALGADRAE
jgi:hypothetical protein